MNFELVSVEWSDYGDTVTVLDSCTANNMREAARIFRDRGHHNGYIRESGSHIMRALDLELVS